MSFLNHKYFYLVLGVLFLIATPASTLITILLDVNNFAGFILVTILIGLASLSSSVYFFYLFNKIRKAQGSHEYQANTKSKKLLKLAVLIFALLLLGGFGYWAFLIFVNVVFG